ncbi:MAG: hypothetical protein P9L94_19625 [Candidatus Hinthialibacter antarcticus]|nr:hypothetical protein [Candidatus Hinthialibacter antarcticus]
MENLNEIIDSLTDDQKKEVAEFVQTMMARGSQRVKTRLRQDWAGKLSPAPSGQTMLELQQTTYHS